MHMKMQTVFPRTTVFATTTSILFLLLITPHVIVSANDTENAEEARWLVQSTNWATLSWIENGDVSSMVTSHAVDDDGHIYINIPHGEEFKGALTFSEAQIDPNQFDGAKCGPKGNLDPEDPRCAKLTVSGTFKPVTDDKDLKLAKDTMYTLHPEMKMWPQDHGFAILKFEVFDVWMIANFGGGGNIPTDAYFAATPKHHAVEGFGGGRRVSVVEDHDRHRKLERPSFSSAAAHARWLVANSLWTTVSTDASQRLKEDNQAWGNIRSTHDGECLASSMGLPVFYLPTPDPTNVDIQANSAISLSFTEANMPELVGEDGSVCNGMDPEDPTCAKISLHGQARPLTDEELVYALKAFGTTHPRGSWLSSGGGHTGGNYYTIDLKSIEFFRNYGGMAALTVDDYLAWKPSTSDGLPADQLMCDSRTVGGNSIGSLGGAAEHQNWSGGMGMEHGEGGGMGMGMWGGDRNGRGGGFGMGDGSGPGRGRNFGNFEENEPSASEESFFTLSSFVLGTVFGFIVWGPTLAVFIYFKYHRGKQSKYQNVNAVHSPQDMKDPEIV